MSRPPGVQDRDGPGPSLCPVPRRATEFTSREANRACREENQETACEMGGKPIFLPMLLGRREDTASRRTGWWAVSDTTERSRKMSSENGPWWRRHPDRGSFGTVVGQKAVWRKPGGRCQREAPPSCFTRRKAVNEGTAGKEN